MIIPLIVVVPGIVAYAMNVGEDGTLNKSLLDQGFFGPSGSIVSDNAAPWLINSLVPTGLKGLVLAALAAAIVSSLASMLNSTSTIFTMDIYRAHINKDATDKQTVNTGRVTAFVALVIAVLIAPQLGNLGQAFQFIQEYTGVVSPGILAVFLAGLFFKMATNNGAIWGILSSIPIAMYFKVAPNEWLDSELFINIPFMQQMMVTCIVSLIIILAVSYYESKGRPDEKGIELSKSMFETGYKFNISAAIILIICAGLYAFFW